MKYSTYILLTLISLSTFISCTEPYNLNSEYFDEQVVIEATITNRLEKQRIKVAKTYPIDSTTYQPAQTGVSVKIKEGQGAEYSFSYQEEDSTFVSDEVFQAQPNTLYTLEVTTANDMYTATSRFENPVELDSINIIKTTNQEGEEGLDIAINSQDSNENAKFYRFKYKETFKITAPYFSPYKAILVELPPEYPQFFYLGKLVVHTYDDEIYTDVCYRTEYSKKPILTTTLDLTEDDLVNFSLKFIPKTDYKINERYSIKVTQYLQSFEAYTFYKTLADLNFDDEILSPNQPGFVQGNIQSVNFPDKNVIGFFEVSPTSSKRIYINWQDYFPNDLRPEYFRECEVLDFDKLQPAYSSNEFGINEGLRLVEIVRDTTLIYYDSYNFYAPEIGNQNYLMVKPECGDCAVLGNPEPPDFWEE